MNRTKLLGSAVAIVRDVAGLAGAGSIVWGCYLVHPALGYIVAGIMLLAGAIVAAARGLAERIAREF